MAQTAIHDMVERCRAGQHAPCVARLASGWVVMGEQQVLPGYCLLLPDPVVGQLNALTGSARAQFLSDMAVLGDALGALTAAVRMNYAILGNVEPALHAHVFPRLASEALAIQKLQPFALDWASAPRYSEALCGDFKRRLVEALGAR
jgi:diadenosine tetraphosphate (Ap4A) HIT family hydrolase